MNVIRFYLDQPFNVDLNPSTGELSFLGTQVSPSLPDCALEVTLSPAATQNFFRVLKALETIQGAPLEQLAKPGSVQ